MIQTNDGIDASIRIAARLTLTGRVQGIGMRPAIARFAQQLSLTGSVGNTHGGVEVHVEGAACQVERFKQELQAQLPSAADVSSVSIESANPTGLSKFSVLPGPASETNAGNVEPHPQLSASVPPDVMVCGACREEVATASQRRHGYPFTSCTNCGPRYSIIERMPYERVQTSMLNFPLCGPCSTEYGAASDRRFHAQTNACPTCGPRIWMQDADGRSTARGGEALRGAAATILAGRILALRGLGGYQLLVDATSQDAVERLRQRKRRRGKPLAVMVTCLAEAERLALLDATERGLLGDSAGPIVIASARCDSPLAAAVSGGLSTIGLMLPTTPLHELLLASVQRPVVCTSGNAEGEPLAYEQDTADQPLRGVADAWLQHDRPIRRPIDDSVVRVIAGRPSVVRLARGFAPWPLRLESEQPLIALGGHQKTSLALSNGAQAVLGPHLGDLDTIATRERFVAQVADFAGLYGVDAPPLCCDLHPDYFTTQWAEEKSSEVIRVQHHHAHIVSGMLEHGWLDRQVLGVAFDGTGYGPDETIWGGEFLVATATSFERVGHLRPFCLPGGERAVRQPWRVATTLVQDALGPDEAAQLAFGTGDTTALLSILSRPHLSPVTTSAGRLFDGVAALVLGIEQCDFEGQAAILLEAACDCSGTGEYDLPIRDTRTKSLDWRPLIQQLMRDRAAGVAPGTMAIRFHRGLASAVAACCRSFEPLPVVLSGGVFQNRVLVELLAERCCRGSQPIGLPGMIPVNDGGLAAGQLAVAWALAGRGRRTCV